MRKLIISTVAIACILAATTIANATCVGPICTPCFTTPFGILVCP